MLISQKKSAIVPIVFSTNDNYAPYCGVAIQSLKAHASDKHEYHIYVIYTALSESYIEKLESMSGCNVSVKVVNISDLTENLTFTLTDSPAVRHMSVETYYRIFIPAMFDQYEKIVYLDCDLVLCRDIADFFMEELKGNPVGGVYELAILDNSRYADKGKLRKEAFNAGVLLLDTKLYKEHAIMEKAVELIKTGENFSMNDQGLLQTVLWESFTYLDNRWNFCWHSIHKELMPLRPNMLKVYEEIKKDPWIVHFTGQIKPWNSTGREFSELFWEHTKNTLFHDEIVSRYNENIKQKHDDYYSIFPFPTDRIIKNSNIALYGAGLVGWDYYHYLKATGFCNCALWVDKRYEEFRREGCDVNAVEDLLSVDYDVVVIAVKEINLAESIKNELLKIGVPKNKIVWTG